MRTLSATLQAAQESNSKTPCLKLVLTSGVTSYTYSTERILRLSHSEQENSHKHTVVLNNADGALTSLDLKGYDAVFSDGFVTTAGSEYSAHAPLKVLSQRFDSYQGNLACTLTLIGVPDLLREDKANADYAHHWLSTKTVKSLITEVASGTAVSEELTEKQASLSTWADLKAALGAGTIGAYGQVVTIPNRTVNKLSFYLKKTGSPSGNVTFKIVKVSDISLLNSKVLGDASTLSGVGSWQEVTFDTPVAINTEVYIYPEFTNGDGSNYVSVAYNNSNAKDSEYAFQINTVGNPITIWPDYDCAYSYKYTGDGISVYDHCTAYDVVFDSEDSLIDAYMPADSLTIKEGEDRLAVIDKLLYYTSCQRVFKADGKIHVFVPTTTGTAYDAEYSLASGHTFFSKALLKGLVVPNKIFVKSNKTDAIQYSGSATSADSFALLPMQDIYRTTLESDAQGNSMAAAIISRMEISQQQGSATIPVNCGAELYDYVKVTDSREDDSRVGNLGSLTTTYKAGRKGESRYDMTFSFGRVALKSVAGTRSSSLITTGLTNEDGSIPWPELYVLLQEMTDNLHDLNVAMGWVEAETLADEVVESALLSYLKSALLSYLKNTVTVTDVTASRAVGTAYQVTAPLTIVTITLAASSVGYVYIGSTSATSIGPIIVGVTSGIINAPATIPLPKGWWYKVTSASSIVSCYETTIGV